MCLLVLRRMINSITCLSSTWWKVKLTSQELSDVMMQSVALSTILKVWNYDREQSCIHKAKQSLKTTTGFLNNYVDKVFQVDDAESEEGQHMKTES
jgi:hypothetical protein